MTAFVNSTVRNIIIPAVKEPPPKDQSVDDPNIKTTQ